MKKLCPLCGQALKDNDLVVVLLLAKIKLKEESYELDCQSQTISSHLFCIEKPKEEPK